MSRFWILSGLLGTREKGRAAVNRRARHDHLQRAGNTRQVFFFLFLFFFCFTIPHQPVSERGQVIEASFFLFFCLTATSTCFRKTAGNTRQGCCFCCLFVCLFVCCFFFFFFCLTVPHQSVSGRRQVTEERCVFPSV